MNKDVSVVLLANRAPVSFTKSDDGYELERGAGGLVGALDPVARGLGERAVWVATATSETDREAVAAGAAKDIASTLGYPVHLLDLDPDVYAKYYDAVSNRMLWFANHCLWDEMGIDGFGEEEVEAWQSAYEPVNQRFSEAAAEVSNPDSLVLFQDYHLSTAPGHMRRARPKQTISHFTHSSFCGPEGLDRLPRPIPQKVVEGMLGADLLGFHVPPWCEGFLECCERIGAKVDRQEGLVDHDGRRTWVRSYPIPIDAKDLQERSEGERARDWAQRLSKNEESLIVRADRTEPSKNIVRGFEAYGRLLDRRPDLKGKIRFVACIYPSRQSLDEYQEYSKSIEASVRNVNELHPESIDLYMEDDFDRTVGALMIYDVLLVNSIMDGMNLVSKEGPAVNQRSGVVVLSKGAGSFGELGEHCVQISEALDVDATASALEQALEIDGDLRKTRAEELRRKVEASTPANWIETQIDDLAEIQAGREPRTPP